MIKRWLALLIASVPMVAALLVIQSCGGVGGPTVGNNGQGSVSEKFLALLSDGQRTATNIGTDECGKCHATKGVDDPIYDHFKQTAHASNGVTCESCHGPGSAHKATPADKTLVLSFPKISSPVVCAQCHGKTSSDYDFSGHTKLIPSPVNSAITNPTSAKSSRCMACHSGLTRAQVTELGKDFGALSDAEVIQLANDTLSTVPHIADCVTCHNPHKKTGKLTQNGAEAQLRHQVFNLDTTNIAPGTTAATFTNYDHICAQCHNGRGTNPSDSKLTTGTSRPSMHDSNQMQMLMGLGGVEGSGAVANNTAHQNAPGQCTKCHMPDSRHTFTVSYDKGCAPCHTVADATNRATTIKSEILNDLVNLRARMERWATANVGGKELWDYTSLLTAEGFTPPDQALIPLEVKRSRHNYYFVIRSGDYGVHNAPYAKHLIKVANDNLTALGVAKTVSTRAGMTQAEMLGLVEGDKSRAQKADLQELE